MRWPIFSSLHIVRGIFRLASRTRVVELAADDSQDRSRDRAVAGSARSCNVHRCTPGHYPDPAPLPHRSRTSLPQACDIADAGFCRSPDHARTRAQLRKDRERGSHQNTLSRCALCGTLIRLDEPLQRRSDLLANGAASPCLTRSATVMPALLRLRMTRVPARFPGLAR